MKRAILFPAVAAAMLISTVACAQMRMPAEDPYMPAMESMDRNMQHATSPDATMSYAKKMIAHHRGAVDMSRVVLETSKDPMIRAMAAKTIKDQTKEAADLQSWVNKHGG